MMISNITFKVTTTPSNNSTDNETKKKKKSDNRKTYSISKDALNQQKKKSPQKFHRRNKTKLKLNLVKLKHKSQHNILIKSPQLRNSIDKYI